MKLSQALREVARLHAEDPGNELFENGICWVVWRTVAGRYADPLYAELNAVLRKELGLRRLWLYRPGDWTARPWMCLLLAEYLEDQNK